MHFIETFGIFDFILSINTNKVIFIKNYSSFYKILKNLLPSFFVKNSKIQKLEIGFIQDAGQLRSNAFKNAENSLKFYNLNPMWVKKISKNLNIDGTLILEKLIFETNYERYLFYESIFQYLFENKSKALVKIDCERNCLYVSKFKSFNNVKLKLKASNLLNKLFVNSIYLLFWSVYNFVFTACKTTKHSYSKAICCVDDLETFTMMNNLFRDAIDTKFVIERQYLSEINQNKIKKNDIHILRLSYKNYFKVLKLLPSIFYFSFCDKNNFKKNLILPSMFYNHLFKGFEITPEHNCKYLFFTGHLTLVRSIRNEILKSINCQSVFIPKDSYVSHQEFCSEWKINYDIFISSGVHSIDLYKKKKSITKNFFICGSYKSNFTENNFDNKTRYLPELKNFKKDKMGIVFLSPGICDETLSNEKKLVKFAKELAVVDKVKIFFRRKPTNVDLKYRDFYKKEFKGFNNIILTSNKVDLYTFLDVGDLFITSISSSACDIAVKNGQVFFIDFMNTPKLYLPWEKIPELVLKEQEALSTVKFWINSSRNSSLRKKHQVYCSKLKKYVGYVKKDFSSYKMNLLKNLNI